MAGSNDSTITLTILAKNLASGEIGKFVSGIDSMAKQGGIMGNVFKGVGISMGMMLNPVALVATAIGTVTDALGDSVAAFKDDQASQTKLVTSLEANIDAWDGNTASIEATMKARMDLGFSDDEQRDSLAVLVAITKDSTEALDLQRTAMDLARLKGIDLEAASLLLAKVWGGNVTILKRSGIQLKDGATATEALAEVQKLAAGQAKAWGEDSAHAAEITALRVGELQEKLGGFVSGGFDAFTGFLGSIVDVLDGPDGANALAADLVKQIYAVDRAASGEAPVAVDQFAKDIESMTVALREFDQMRSGIAKDWVMVMDPATLVASGLTLDAVYSIAVALQETGGSVDDFKAKMAGFGPQVAEPLVVVAAVADDAATGVGHAFRSMARSAGTLNRSFESKLNALTGITEGALDAAATAAASGMADIAWSLKHPLEGAKLAAFYGSQVRAGTRAMNQALASGNATAYAKAKAFVADYKAKLNELRLQEFAVKVQMDFVARGGMTIPGIGSWGGGRAAGGPVTAGTAYLVGERGPEVFRPGQSGRIEPNGGGGGVHVHFHGVVAAPSEAEGERLARVIGPHIRRELQRTGAAA